MISMIVGRVKFEKKSFPQLIRHCQSVTNLLSHEHTILTSCNIAYIMVALK